MDQSPELLAASVKSLATALGFDRVGIAPALPTRETRYLREWVARGYAGSMGYLEGRLEERVDPRKVLEGALNVIAVGFFYAETAGAGSTGDGALEAGTAQVARYARGEDYHDVLGDRIQALGHAVEAVAQRPVSWRAYVDTGPIAERAFAARAGLGWIGKNTCLIDVERGSYLFLGALLTDLELTFDVPEPDHCGTCSACLDACPTQAFEAPYVLDARKCIAFTTIEDPGPMDRGLRESHDDRVFGCDVCQEVCPWNRPRERDPLPDGLGLRERLRARPEWEAPSLGWILSLDVDAWRTATTRSALRRAKHRGLLRNALVAAGNSGDRSLIPKLRQYEQGADGMLAEHARWALDRLSFGTG